MLLARTVITLYDSNQIEAIKAEMLSLGLAQNVTTPSNIEGDWVDPTKLGMSYGTYLHRVKALQLAHGCKAHVEIS